METLTVALWAINLEPPATTLAAWVAGVEAWLMRRLPVLGCWCCGNSPALSGSASRPRVWL